MYSLFIHLYSNTNTHPIQCTCTKQHIYTIVKSVLKDFWKLLENCDLWRQCSRNTGEFQWEMPFRDLQGWSVNMGGLEDRFDCNWSTCSLKKVEISPVVGACCGPPPHQPHHAHVQADDEEDIEEDERTNSLEMSIASVVTMVPQKVHKTSNSGYVVVKKMF